MSDVFISYARSTEPEAIRIASVLNEMGYDVWRDDEIPANRAFGDMIEERLVAAKAVLVLWSAEAARSEWVRSEASRARALGKLVQLTLDRAPLPMPFDQIECANLVDWTGRADAPGWRKVIRGVAELAGPPIRNRAGGGVGRARGDKPSICVLPFSNMSDDPQQEYFSDGISEDIITDLSKVSALSVTARNTSFSFKGKGVDVRSVAQNLNVSHVLEGSVRKAGGRVRITAQLIDGAAGDHVWSERYDRDLTDIFALQDEISQAIVAAMKLKLLPEEKFAIERRGTSSAEAYNLYLQARRLYVSGNQGDVRADEAMLRLCRQAIQVDPGFARAWALMALAQRSLHFASSRFSDGGLEAAEKALSLDPYLAEAHAVKAVYLSQVGRRAEALAEIDVALRLDSEAYEVNRCAGNLFFQQRELERAIVYFEKAASVLETDFVNLAMLIACYTGIDKVDEARRVARMTVDRAEQALAQDQSNGAAMAHGAAALAALGETDQAREWIRRALVIDPDNLHMRYNLGCVLLVDLEDPDAALELFGPVFAGASKAFLDHAKQDPDLASLRSDPRFIAMIAAAESRFSAGLSKSRAEVAPPRPPEPDHSP
jgi:adenylate cyclase